jgi:hypothetical protein
MAFNTKIIVDIVLSVGTLVIIFATEPIYNESLFNWSIDNIPQLQSEVSDFGLTLWEIWSAVGLAIASFIPIIITLIMTLT